jgi:hypothetical protein
VFLTQVDGVYRYLLAWTGDQAAAKDLTEQVFRAAQAWLPVAAGVEAGAPHPEPADAEDLGAWLGALDAPATPDALVGPVAPGQRAAHHGPGAGVDRAAAHQPAQHRAADHPAAADHHHQAAHHHGRDHHQHDDGHHRADHHHDRLETRSCIRRRMQR